MINYKIKYFNYFLFFILNSKSLILIFVAQGWLARVSGMVGRVREKTCQGENYAEKRSSCMFLHIYVKILTQTQQANLALELITILFDLSKSSLTTKQGIFQCFQCFQWPFPYFSRSSAYILKWSVSNFITSIFQESRYKKDWKIFELGVTGTKPNIHVLRIQT